MDCDELTQILPDLIDGTLSEERRVETMAALNDCPDCQRQYELARQIHLFLAQLQSENEQFRVPPGFEARLLTRIRRQHGNLDLLDLSSQTFVQWLAELINLVAALLSPEAGVIARSNPQRA